MMTDPIADLLARIRNGAHARHTRVRCPASKQKLAIANVLSESSFVGDVRVEQEGARRMLTVGLRYDAEGRPVIAGMRRVSRPGRRGCGGGVVENRGGGVTKPFVGELEIQGVGYRAEVAGRTLRMLIGFSHPVEVA